MVTFCAISASPAHASDANHALFAEKLEWCYRHQTNLYANVDDTVIAYTRRNGTQFEPWSFNKLNRPITVATPVGLYHMWYVLAIHGATAIGDAKSLRGIYRACQAKDLRAIQYLESESDADLIRAARYIVACKPTDSNPRNLSIEARFCTTFLETDAKICTVDGNSHSCSLDMMWPPGLE